MSRSLLKLIAAQRLLDETRELLEDEALFHALRKHDQLRGERLGAGDVSAAARIEQLESLVDRGRKFGTVYADPPWQYENAASRGAAKNHYRTMNLAAIASLPVAKLAAEHAHLHLWTTNGFLFEAQQ